MNEKSITQTQLFFLIFQSQVGIGLLSLPYSVHEHVQSDGWISVLLAGASIQLLIILLWILLWGFKGKNIYEITVIVFGKYLGKFINFLYIFFFLLVMSLVALLFANLLKKWILDYTPFSIIILLLIGTGIYIGKHNLRVLARFYTLATGLIIIAIALPWFSFSSNFQFAYLFPIGQSGVKNIVIGAHRAIVAMIGFELILVILPYVEGTYKRSLKNISLANTMVTLLYVYFTVSCYLIFSPEEITIVPEPVLYILKAANFQWIERLDLIFLSIWIIPMITSFVTYLYLASSGAATILHKGKRKYPVWYLPVIVFLIGFLFSSESDIEHFDKYVSFITYVFLAVIPLLTLFVSLVRKKFNYRSPSI
ncbi:GerAB/ArcD/ProY family transporter [Neobacillus sp. NRS-1170]|uniref:GerAB/ArcD/ProY family transporter n=1 Tax=Neobacillus sp. NRS-1170 TaxID=3233898 RepID=UPI003D28BA61